MGAKRFFCFLVLCAVASGAVRKDNMELLSRMPRTINLRADAFYQLRNDQQNDESLRGAISDDCVNAVYQYRLSSSIKMCQDIFGWTSPPPIQPACPRPVNFGTSVLPVGSCCDRNQDCASGFCDGFSRTCTYTCTIDGSTDQCGAAASAAGGVAPPCTDCLCPSTTLCNQNQFCQLCDMYVGPATEDVRMAAGCDVVTLPAADSDQIQESTLVQACNVDPACMRNVAIAAGVLAQPDCFIYLDFGGVNASCAVSLLTQRDLLVIANMTWCERNNDGNFCGLVVDTVLSAISLAVNSSAVCDALTQAGCCVGNMLSALQYTGDTTRFNHLVAWQQLCNVPQGQTCAPWYGTSGLSKGAIAGIVVAVVVAVAAIVGAAIWVIRSRTDERRWRTLGDEEMQHSAQQTRVLEPPAAIPAVAGSGSDGSGVGGGGGEGYPDAPDMPSSLGGLDPRTLELFVGGGGGGGEENASAHDLEGSGGAAAAPPAEGGGKDGYEPGPVKE